MNIREQISNSLLALLNTAVFDEPINTQMTWVNIGNLQRRLKSFDDVPPSAQPALYLVGSDEEDVQQGRGIPVKRIINYWVVCYCRAEVGDVGDSFLNVMQTAIENSIFPSPSSDGVQSIGGLVYKCWIKGKILRDPGDLDNQAMLIVPIEVTIP